MLQRCHRAGRFTRFSSFLPKFFVHHEQQIRKVVYWQKWFHTRTSHWDYLHTIIYYPLSHYMDSKNLLSGNTWDNYLGGKDSTSTQFKMLKIQLYSFKKSFLTFHLVTFFRSPSDSHWFIFWFNINVAAIFIVFSFFWIRFTHYWPVSEEIFTLYIEDELDRCVLTKRASDRHHFKLKNFKNSRTLSVSVLFHLIHRPGRNAFFLFQSLSVLLFNGMLLVT